MSSSSSSSSSRRIVRVRGRPYIDLADPPSASKSSSSKNVHEEARRKANVNANDSRGWRDDAAFRRHTSDDIEVEVAGEEERYTEDG